MTSGTSAPSQSRPGRATSAPGGPPPGAPGERAAAAAFWNACPRRRLDWREGDDGQCIVLRPKLGESRAGRWLASRFRDPCYRIRLDDVGTFVWRACDGETPLATILARMRDAFGAHIEPADERLGRFIQSMLRSRMLEF